MSVWGRLGLVALGAIASGCLAFGLISLSPLGQVSVRVDMTTTAAGFSQMFYSDENQAFTEPRSSGAPVLIGPNAIVFTVAPLRQTLGDQLRWDPINAPARITVSKISVSSAFAASPVPLGVLRPGTDVSALTITDGVLAFDTFSNDAHVLLEAGVRGVQQRTTSFITMLSMIVTLGVGLALIWFAFRRRPSDATPSPISKLAKIVFGVFAVSAGLLLLSWSLVVRS